MSDRNNASDTMSPPNDTGAHAKRKSDEGGPQPRAKRNRYISIAWYVCHVAMLPVAESWPGSGRDDRLTAATQQ